MQSSVLRRGFLTRTAWISLLLGCALALAGSCRVGYDETSTQSDGVTAGETSSGAAGEPSGGTSGVSTGGAAGSGQGGSRAGSTASGGTDSPGGEGGDSGGTDTGGTAGTATGGGGMGGAGGRATGGAAGAGRGGAGGSIAGGGAGGSTAGGGAGGSTAGGGAGGSTAGGGAGGSIAGGGAGGSTAGGGAGGSGGAPDPGQCLNATFGGHDYLLCEELRNWAGAVAGCAAIGMQLIRVDDAAENQWLFDNANTQPGRDSLVWIGATDQVVEGEWRWTDGSLFWVGGPAPGGMAQGGLFVAWYFREPNNVSMTEHCASLDTTGSTPEWYDTRCELAQPFVCESL